MTDVSPLLIAFAAASFAAALFPLEFERLAVKLLTASDAVFFNVCALPFIVNVRYPWYPDNAHPTPKEIQQKHIRNTHHACSLVPFFVRIKQDNIAIINAVTATMTNIVNFHCSVVKHITLLCDLYKNIMKYIYYVYFTC